MLSTRQRLPLKPITGNVSEIDTVVEMKRRLRSAKDILKNEDVPAKTSRISKSKAAPKKVIKNKLRVSDVSQQVEAENSQPVNQKICNQQSFEQIISEEKEIDLESLYEIKQQKEEILRNLSRKNNITKLFFCLFAILFSISIVAY